MKPFFTYFGGKWRTAPKYPHPTHDRLVEPFAGAAGYAVRHHTHAVELYDANEKIIGLWQYLIASTPDEIRRLPLIVTHVDDLDVCQEAKWLIGFWLNKGATGPRLSPSKWMRDGNASAGSFWGEIIRERIASQVDLIKHWSATLCEYQDVPTGEATWFVDPPYDHASGTLYPKKVVNFTDLGGWCKNLEGQVIVCEREGADWLPFEPVEWVTQGLHGKRGEWVGTTSPEVMWSNG